MINNDRVRQHNVTIAKCINSQHKKRLFIKLL